MWLVEVPPIDHVYVRRKSNSIILILVNAGLLYRQYNSSDRLFTSQIPPSSTI